MMTSQCCCCCCCCNGGAIEIGEEGERSCTERESEPHDGTCVAESASQRIGEDEEETAIQGESINTRTKCNRRGKQASMQESESE